jgi:DNA-binding winged helix-turn-helix (wHTH) protein
MIPVADRFQRRQPRYSHANAYLICEYGQVRTIVVNLRSGELHKAGKKLKLQEQPFKVLAKLLEQAGKVVTREDLRKQL